MPIAVNEISRKPRMYVKLNNAYLRNLKKHILFQTEQQKNKEVSIKLCALQRGFIEAGLLLPFFK